MKSNIKLLSLLALAFIVVFASCKPDDPEATPEEKKLEELQGTWNITGVSVLDNDLTGVSINFNAENKTYSVTGLNTFTDANLNNGDVLAESGGFSLSSNLNVVTLNPGGALTISNLNKENGNLTLSYSASFPKATDAEQSISLDLVLQN